MLTIETNKFVWGRRTMNSMFVSLSGAKVLERKMEIISNNIANVNSDGFKRQFVVVRMQDVEVKEADLNLINPEVSQEILPELHDDLTYSKLYKKTTDFSQGAMKRTNNPFDVAIEGDGFFTLEDDKGKEFYTKKGSFTLNDQSELVTADGKKVMMAGDKKPIVIEGKDFNINQAGEIMVDGQTIGNIKIVSFETNNFLKRVGETNFQVINPAFKPKDAENCKVMQGYLESSNVDTIKEMIEMIDTSRAYESYQKTVQFDDDSTAKLISFSMNA